MMLTLTTGSKGKLKASGREFEIVATTSLTSTIRFRGEREEYEINDEDLRAVAIQIEDYEKIEP